MTCMWSSQKCGTRSIYGETVSGYQPPRVPLSWLHPSNQINGRIPRSSVLEKPRYSWDGPTRGPPPSIGILDSMELVVLAAFFSIELDHLTFDVKGWEHQICVFFQVCLISSTVWPSNLQFHTFVTQSFLLLWCCLPWFLPWQKERFHDADVVFPLQRSKKNSAYLPQLSL